MFRLCYDPFQGFCFSGCTLLIGSLFIVSACPLLILFGSPSIFVGVNTNGIVSGVSVAVETGKRAILLLKGKEREGSHVSQPQCSCFDLFECFSFSLYSVFNSNLFDEDCLMIAALLTIINQKLTWFKLILIDSAARSARKDY